MSQTTCSIEECDRASRKRSWCEMHYSRWKRHGDPMIETRKHTAPGTPTAHFLEHLMTATAECKIWPFSKTPDGYGSLWQDGRLNRVHVLACIAWNGPRPEGMYAAHGPCHNPSCWNGAHLSWKTPAGNAADRYRDGTAQIGSRNSGARFTEADIPDIRARREAGETYLSIAQDLGVGEVTVYNICERRSWRHVP